MNRNERSDIAYELALLQFNQDGVSEERLNVGVLALAAATGQVGFKFSDHYGRLAAAYPDFQGASYRGLLGVLRQNAKAVQSRGSKGRQLALPLDRPSRIENILDQVAPMDGLNFNWSTVRTGVARSLETAVDKAFAEFVVSREPKQRVRRDDDALWRDVLSAPAFERVATRLRDEIELETDDYHRRFRKHWVNGTLNVLQPMSFDYVDPADLPDKAATWVGRVAELGRTNDFKLLAIVSDPPTSAMSHPYEQACHILARDTDRIRVFRESEVDYLVKTIERDLDGEHRA